MRYNAIILGLLIAFCIGLSHVMQESGPISGSSEKVNTKAQEASVPDLIVTDISGTRKNLLDFSGQVVVLNFWASWCAPCVVELPQMVGIARKNPEEITLVAISIDESRNELDRFLKKAGIDGRKDKNILIVHDQDRYISRDVFGTIRVPETIIIAPDQKMVRKIIGDEVDWAGMEIMAYLSGLHTGR